MSKINLRSKEYSFLQEHPVLQGNILLLGYGGSHAYGTNLATSDVDIRGIYMNNRSEILGIAPDSEQVTDSNTDTVIYSFRKMLHLLQGCNPNTIEILGLRGQDYLYMTNLGQMLLDNKEIFLSQKAIYTFGKYAESQLNRLINKSGRGKQEIVSNEARSLHKAAMGFYDRYKDYLPSKDSFQIRAGEDTVYMDLQLQNFPVEKVAAILNEINAVHKDYSNSSRNSKAIEHGKLSKHMMHLLRLYMMGIDILGKGEIITYRKEEHELLMAIRNGDFLESDGLTPTKDFENLLHNYQERFQDAAIHTRLPEKPDFNKINRLAMQITKLYLNDSLYITKQMPVALEEDFLPEHWR